MNFLSSILKFGIWPAVMWVSCAPPPSPTNSDSSYKVVGSGSGANSSNAGALPGQVTAGSQGLTWEVIYGGAGVGDATRRERATACIQGTSAGGVGHFFDEVIFRDGTACQASIPLAKVPCTLDKITKLFSPNQASQFASMLQDKLAGFKLDQCIYCSTASDNKYCKGAASPLPTGSGLRLYFIKALPGVLDKYNFPAISVTSIWVPFAMPKSAVTDDL